MGVCCGYPGVIEDKKICNNPHMPMLRGMCDPQGIGPAGTKLGDDTRFERRRFPIEFGHRTDVKCLELRSS